MTGSKRRGKKKNKQKATKKDNVHVEELSTGNDSDDLPAHRKESDNVSAHENETDHLSVSSQECQPLPTDKLYFKSTEFTQTCKIQSRCYVSNTVNTLRIPKLKPEQEWFLNHSQFCHFFHMPDEPNLKLLGMWMLLLHTIPLFEEEDTAWFDVNGVPIRYSIREHALISGLDCHEYPAKYEKIGSFAFVDRHFKSHKEITMKSVEEKLLSMSVCGDRLRMAVLYFLGTVIRGNGKYNAPFDSFILRVVNDVEVCKTFPWGRLTFDDALRSITHVMKHLKGKPKKNVNFPGFIIPLEVLAFECIPALFSQFREGVAGCMSDCPRMCKRWFQSNSMKGYPLEDLYDALGKTKVIKSVLVPTIDEELLMARIMDGEPDYENEEGVSNLWSTWLTVKEKPIFWEGLYELDVAAREFPKKKGKEKVNEEASSSNHGLEDVLKGFEEKVMTCLSEVKVKVKTMDKRLRVMEKSHVVLKRRVKRMKAIEKRLEDIENCQYHLKKRARKQKVIEERIDGIEKEMKRKENDNSEGFDYQNMDFNWDGGRSERNEEETDAQKTDKDKENEEAETEIDEKESEEKAHKEDKEVEIETQAEEGEEGEVETETQAEEVEKQDEEGEVETQAEEGEEGEVETQAEEVEKHDEEGEVETQAEEVEKQGEDEVEKQGEENVETEAGEEVKEGEEVQEEGEEVQEEAELNEEKDVEKELEQAELNEEKEVEKEGRIYTEKEKKGWILTVCNTSYVHDVGKTAGTDEASKTHARVGIKMRNKCAAKRKYAPAKRPRGRPRKSDTPQKFTPPPAKRARVPSQWVQSPFTEGKSDETEEPKKKRKTKAKA